MSFRHQTHGWTRAVADTNILDRARLLTKPVPRGIRIAKINAWTHPFQDPWGYRPYSLARGIARGPCAFLATGAWRRRPLYLSAVEDTCDSGPVRNVQAGAGRCARPAA